MKNAIIDMKDVHRVFTLGDVEVNALRGVDLVVKRGEFVVILGPSGSGKTTLLNQIGGIDTPTSGKIVVNDVDITKFNDKELTQHRRLTIGWIFQFHNLIPSLTAIENVILALEMAEIKENQRERAKESLRMVGLEGLEDRMPAQLSGGQQQRVAIARALVKKPDIIVADEATGNLDRTTGIKVIETMMDLCKKENITFCLVTHDPSLAKYADRLLIMDDGILYENNPEKLAMYGLEA